VCGALGLGQPQGCLSICLSVCLVVRRPGPWTATGLSVCLSVWVSGCAVPWALDSHRAGPDCCCYSRGVWRRRCGPRLRWRVGGAIRLLLVAHGIACQGPAARREAQLSPTDGAGELVGRGASRVTPLSRRPQVVSLSQFGGPLVGCCAVARGTQLAVYPTALQPGAAPAPKAQWRAHEAPVTALHRSAFGVQLLTGASDGCVHMWAPASLPGSACNAPCHSRQKCDQSTSVARRAEGMAPSMRLPAGRLDDMLCCASSCWLGPLVRGLRPGLANGTLLGRQP
jgi:hypothetical protein